MAPCGLAASPARSPAAWVCPGTGKRLQSVTLPLGYRRAALESVRDSSKVLAKYCNCKFDVFKLEKTAKYCFFMI